MILLDTQKKEFNKLKDIRIFGKIDNENRFNGNLLIIGLGGVGSSVAGSLKGMLMDDITQDDNIGFLIFDSDIPAMEAAIEASKDGVGFNAMEVVSIYRPNLDTLLTNGIAKNPVHPNLAKWMDIDFPNVNIGTNGAGGNRQIGRLMFSNAYEDVRMLLFDKLDDMYYKSETGKLDVIIVSGVSGGTGSGILADVAYNIRAYGKAKRFKDLRIGACLLMPDVLFGNRAVADNSELMDLMNANGCACLKEVAHYMKLYGGEDIFSFESTTHRISIREDIFDSCMLVSGRKDEQGYLPESVIYSDAAYFLYKLACNKYIGSEQQDGNRKLLRDVFFEKNKNGSFKIAGETDYKIPIREIENICEYKVFSEAYKMLFKSPLYDENVRLDVEKALSEIKDFLDGKPGDEINLNIGGLIKTGQYVKPAYKLIKKGQDMLRSSMGKQLTGIKEDVAVMIKSLKNKLWSSLDELISKCMREYGPFAVLDMIGAAGLGGSEYDRGLIAEIQKLANTASQYAPTGEYSRIVESIKDIVAKRFFTFPSAKRETEDGYYDACIKEALATERNILMDGLDANDVFGDTVRWLRMMAERLEDVYAQFGEDLKNAVEDLANNGKNVIGYILKDANHHEFLPADYITEARVIEVKDALVRLLVENEADIDNGRSVPVKNEMERIYKNLFASVGMFGPEKLILTAFSEEKPTMQEVNVMFVSAENERREEVMGRAAKSFVEGASDKVQRKKLCIIKSGVKEKLRNRKYISLPDSMPHFSKAVKELLVNAPYNEDEASITMNSGEIEISVDDMYIDIPLSALACADDMQAAYDKTGDDYKGLHIDEVDRDMRGYSDLV